MPGWQLALYGLFGGFAITGWDLAKVIHAKGRWPWRVKGAPTMFPYWTAEAIRIVLGGGLAWTAAASGQVSTPIAAVAIGTAAPLIIERMSRRDTEPSQGDTASERSPDARSTREAVSAPPLEPHRPEAEQPRSSDDTALRSPAGGGGVDAG
ncbi:MAG TPA: hypothetical protein VH352_14450 [Pseudonocardiaceae bacterium]|nr:hypothetical protein [Pseudonocardiaceae bacterium]